MTRNHGLDGARGLAALSVALGHCVTIYTSTTVYEYRLRDLPHLSLESIILRLWDVVFNGDAAVALFFVLSGFVLGRSLENQPEPPARAVVPYLLRRIFRLYPTAIAAGAIAFALYPITIEQMLGSMLLTSLIPNGVIWTLQVELVGSAAIFFLWAANSRKLLMTVTAIYVALWIFVPRSMMIVRSDFIMFPFAFVLGYALPLVDRRIWSSKWILLIGLAAFFLSDIVIGRTWRAHAGHIFGAVLIVGVLQFRAALVIERGPIQFLGRVSYPFYLLHAMIAHALMPAIDVIAPNSSLLDKVLLLAALSVAVGLIAADVVSRLVEQPGIRIGGSLIRLLRARAAAAAVTRSDLPSAPQ